MLAPLTVVASWMPLSLSHNERPLTRSQQTKDVRLDPQLNKKVWEAGIKGVPFRLRVRISRKRNDEEGAKEKLYSYVQAVNVKDPKGLHTQVVEDA
jgi:large subunit ribosomal protein L31e